MSDARLVKLLSAKIEELEAELAAAKAEVEHLNEALNWSQLAESNAIEALAERDELLRDALPFVRTKTRHEELADRIDAALAKGGGDE